MNEHIVEKKQTSGGWTWAEPKGELIRCKDCKYCEKTDWLNEWYGLCRYYNSHSVQADDFCSRAERKEE